MLENILYIYSKQTVNYMNGQSAAKLLSTNNVYEEGSTTIETTLLEDKGVEYTINDSGKGRDLNTTFIYALVESGTNNIRYVGKANDIQHRLKGHLNTDNNTHKSNWIKSANKQIELFVLDEVDISDWQFWEIYWISQCKAWGFNLTNHTTGGDGLTNMTFSKEHIRKLSESHKGKVYPKGNYGKHVLRKICQYEDNKLIRTWDSIKEAAKFYNVDYTSISHCCAGRKKKIKGFVWKYLD